MREKLTVEQFRQIKNQIMGLYEQWENEDNDTIEEKLAEQIQTLQDRLLSYDLSNIPFEEWNEYPIYSDNTHAADFSKTKANIDFALVDYDGNGNFKGCNVKNLDKIFAIDLNPKEFDEQTIKNNSNIFLSDAFSNEFKDKYYNRSLTLEDLASLSSSQLDELKQKNVTQHLSVRLNILPLNILPDSTNISSKYYDHLEDEYIIKYLGIDRAIQLYHYSPQELKEVNQILYGLENSMAINYTPSSDLKKLISQLNNTNINNIKNVCFNYVRQLILTSNKSMNPQKIPSSFIEENKDIFLINAKVPDEVKERFFKRELTIQDLINYRDAFQTFPIDHFTDNNFVKFINHHYGMGQFQKLVEHYPYICLYLGKMASDNVSNSKFNDFQSYLATEGNLEANFKQALWNLFNTNNHDYYQKPMPIFVGGTETNLLSVMEETFGKEDGLNFMLIYNINPDTFQSFKLNYNFSKNDLLDGLSPIIFQNIIMGMTYDENMPLRFKQNYPTLFLNPNIPQEIRTKFYNRKFTINDFNENLNLIDLFGNTNVICSLSPKASWMIPLFADDNNQKLANYKRLKIASEYLNIRDNILQDAFKTAILKFGNDINMNNLGYSQEIIKRLEYTNSTEMNSFKDQLFVLLLENEKPIESLDKIENIFIKNNIPLYGKIFSCFEILYPELDKFSFDDSSRMSPELKDMSLPAIGHHKLPNETRFRIIYNDLLRIAYRSNERSFVDFLQNIEDGNNLYENIIHNNLNINSISKEDQTKLETFVSHLETLYQHTQNGSDSTLDLNKYSLEEKVKILGNLFQNNSKYDLPDRIVRSFCYSAGIKSFEELKNLTRDAVRKSSKQGVLYANALQNGHQFHFEEGDFLRCIGDIKTLSSSLNTGNVSKEYLTVFTENSASDTTPLDVDFSLITNTDDIYHAIEFTPTGFGFGNIYVIIKKDNPNLNITRDKEGNLTNTVYNPSKIEIFGTQVKEKGYETHWGARTGFAFTDVDYILYKKTNMIDSTKPYDENGNVNYVTSSTEQEYDDLPAIKFEIARNGYYIPVIDFSGKLIFTLQEYDSLRHQMQGLSYYGEKEYSFSSQLLTPEVEETMIQNEQNNKVTQNKIQAINSTIRKATDSLGLKLKTEIDGDLTEGYVEILNTGSTGRGTNTAGDSDFDFYIRLDNKILNDPNKLEEFKKFLKNEMISVDNENYTSKGDFRYKGVKIEGLEDKIDLDLSFTKKLNKVVYSTDMCLKDRLETIKKQDPEKYSLVVANIQYAKKFLKEKGVYKSKNAREAQGGLGGVGVENWILQNGGSFREATETFLEAAEGRSFEQFKKEYEVWDFGQNIKSANENRYLYDNFVSNNMDESGYKKMVQALKEYQNTHTMQQQETHSQHK